MHRALILCEGAAFFSGSLSSALASCGFDVVERSASPDDDLKGPWALVVRCRGCSGSAPVSYQLWSTQTAGAGLAADSATAFELSEPVKLADLVVPLLALGLPPITDDELAGLFDRLYELASNDDAIVAELIGSLVATNEEDLAALRAALVGRNWGEFASFAHRLKSSARMLACRGLVSVCETLENSGGHDDVPRALALTALITSALTVLNARLRTDLSARRAPERE